MELAAALTLLVALLALDVVATWKLVRDDLSSRRQKLAQLLLVWGVPLIGALVVLAVHRRAEPPSRQYREALDPGDDFGASARQVRALRKALDDEQ